MSIKTAQLELEKRAHEEFKALWRKGKFQGQRYGQAFYDHFRLGRMNNQEQLRGLYEADGDVAHKIIGQVFRFN